MVVDDAALRDPLVGAGLVPARPAPSGAGKVSKQLAFDIFSTLKKHVTVDVRMNR